jgi:hypothetical protein
MRYAIATPIYAHEILKRHPLIYTQKKISSVMAWIALSWATGLGLKIAGKWRFKGLCCKKFSPSLKWDFNSGIKCLGWSKWSHSIYFFFFCSLSGKYFFDFKEIHFFATEPKKVSFKFREISCINSRHIPDNFFIQPVIIKIRGRTMDVLYGIFEASRMMPKPHGCGWPPLITKLNFNNLPKKLRSFFKFNNII